jgi:hypothetical protein
VKLMFDHPVTEGLVIEERKAGTIERQSHGNSKHRTDRPIVGTKQLPSQRRTGEVHERSPDRLNAESALDVRGELPGG